MTWIEWIAPAVSLLGAAYVAIKGATFHGRILQRVDDLENRIRDHDATLEKLSEIVQLVPVLVERIGNLKDQSTNQAADLKHEFKNLRQEVLGRVR